MCVCVRERERGREHAVSLRVLGGGCGKGRKVGLRRRGPVRFALLSANLAYKRKNEQRSHAASSALSDLRNSTGT